MSARVNTTELKKLTADLEASPREARKLSSIIIRKTAFDIERLGKRYAPFDTGNLRNSIGVSMSSGTLAAEIGPTAHYGAHQEYGTVNGVPGKHYMGRAVDQMEPRMLTAFEQMVERLSATGKGGKQ